MQPEFKYALGSPEDDFLIVRIRDGEQIDPDDGLMGDASFVLLYDTLAEAYAAQWIVRGMPGLTPLLPLGAFSRMREAASSDCEPESPVWRSDRG